mmetsp:Transcript_28074/g.28367  ORF Transcript_28074/g.28367 Transcript_28074/m.28367 type:complete len:196 (+) Transcript_28074:70-657(+)
MSVIVHKRKYDSSLHHNTFSCDLDSTQFLNEATSSTFIYSRCKIPKLDSSYAHFKNDITVLSAESEALNSSVIRVDPEFNNSSSMIISEEFDSICPDSFDPSERLHETSSSLSVDHKRKRVQDTISISKGNTSLKNCLQKGMQEAACRLIELGADVDIEDEDALKEIVWQAVRARGNIYRKSMDEENEDEGYSEI